MKNIRIFLLGVWEFRQNATTSFNYPQIKTYDAGRELAHKFTLRRFDYQ